MFPYLPEELNKLILSFMFSGIKCTFCTYRFTKGFFGPTGHHICQKCAGALMYERGSFGLFQKMIYIDNY